MKHGMLLGYGHIDCSVNNGVLDMVNAVATQYIIPGYEDWVPPVSDFSSGELCQKQKKTITSLRRLYGLRKVRVYFAHGLPNRIVSKFIIA